MVPSTKPTVVFIHGSWHSPKHFEPVRAIFEANGYSTECPLQPCFNANPGPPITSLEDDVKAIQALLTTLVDDQGKDIIVAMHSYGGVVGSQSVLESWSKQLRESKGRPGGVLHLLYMCAFVLPLGASLTTALGGTLPPFVKVQDNGLCTMDEPGHRFYNDLPKEEQDRWVGELAPVPVIAHMTPVTYAAYKYYPATYLYCTQDQALPLEVQESMVKGTGVDFLTDICNAGHSPFLSQPTTVLKVVEKIAV